DHLSVGPRVGDIADFVALMERAEQLGLRVLGELVVQHRSDQHPWFQEARRDRNSRYRDWFIWADEPVDMGVEPMFPPEQDSVWTWDEEAGQYYRPSIRTSPTWTWPTRRSAGRCTGSWPTGSAWAWPASGSTRCRTCS